MSSPLNGATATVKMVNAITPSDDDSDWEGTPAPRTGCGRGRARPQRQGSPPPVGRVRPTLVVRPVVRPPRPLGPAQAFRQRFPPLTAMQRLDRLELHRQRERELKAEVEDLTRRLDEALDQLRTRPTNDNNNNDNNVIKKP